MPPQRQISIYWGSISQCTHPHFFLVTSYTLCWTLPFLTKQRIYKKGTCILNSNSPNSYQWNRHNTCRKPNGPQQKLRKLDTERTGNEMHISHASNPLVTTHTRHQLKESMVCSVRREHAMSVNRGPETLTAFSISDCWFQRWTAQGRADTTSQAALPLCLQSILQNTR